MLHHPRRTTHCTATRDTNHYIISSANHAVTVSVTATFYRPLPPSKVPKKGQSERLRKRPPPPSPTFYYSQQVILLEVDVAPELGPTAKVSCYVSLTDDACPRGRVVAAATLHLPSRRPRVFRFEGGPKNTLGPGRTYTVCFGGVGMEDARSRVGR